MKKNNIILIVIFSIVIVLLLSCTYQINEIEMAILLRFEKPVGNSINTPGLKFKIPIIDRVVKYDKRLLDYESKPERVITKDKKTIIIDNYVRWRIEDPLKFLQVVRSEIEAQNNIDLIIYSVIREKIGNFTLNDIVAKHREEIMRLINEESKSKIKEFGIELIDVRIKKAELPKQNEKNVFQRMQTEREQQAKKYRAEGEQKKAEIISQANKEKTIILAEAYKKSQIIKGEGDAEALKIYAEAYNKDKEFYKYMRTLEAYEKILKGKGKNSIILSTQSDLWRILDGVDNEK